MPPDPLPLPASFVATITDEFGDSGREWLERLPRLLAECAEAWSLTLGPTFSPLSYNYVAAVTLPDGAAAVLKIGVPHRELFSEMAALAWYQGRGIAHLYRADRARGAMLLERLRPGAMLASVTDDERATSIAASVMRALWRPAPEEPRDLLTIGGWTDGLRRYRQEFPGGSGPLPAAQVERATGLFAELLASEGEQVLLHGDLHHENILAAERAPWLAIDPKGVVGEREFEPYALLLNRLPESASDAELERLLARRIAQLSEELALDRERVRAWAEAQGTLSAIWCVEGAGDWERGAALAARLAALAG